MNGIAEIRQRRGMTQQELADALMIDRSTVAKWETGASFPTGKKVPLVAQALGCEVNELFKIKEGDAADEFGECCGEGAETAGEGAQPERARSAGRPA